MHVETYPALLTPRDEEPSLSSSEEKSSEFDLLKITRKQKYEVKAEQMLCRIYSLLLPKVLVLLSREQAPESYIYRKLQNKISKVIHPFSKLNN